jgi:16S rRNA (guanine1207-N2)-methyltransferase
MNPALETLMLAFSSEGGIPVPGRCLFLGAEAHPLLKSWRDLTAVQPHKPLADIWRRAGFTAPVETPEGRWPVVLLLPGKSRDEILASFALARDHLEPGGTLVAALPNTTGASRFEKEFARATGSVHSIQKNKSRVFHATDEGTWNEALFEQWRTLGEPRAIPGTSHTTRAGIFSHGEIDAGSQFLVAHLPTDLRGKVADLGAGWGFLSAEALRLAPGIQRIHLFESDGRALACARSNLAEWGDRPVFSWHDVTTGLPGLYDVILTNPPFHSGRDTDVDLGRAFVTSAARALGRTGRLYLVANRHLPYEAVLKAEGLGYERLAEDKTYKVILARKP